MSGWMTGWLVYTVVVSCAALYWYVESRDDSRLVEYYRNKWLDGQSRRNA
jgi:hypothetical protein